MWCRGKRFNHQSTGMATTETGRASAANPNAALREEFRNARTAHLSGQKPASSTYGSGQEKTSRKVSGGSAVSPGASSRAWRYAVVREHAG
jgi:hypothetical protein